MIIRQAHDRAGFTLIELIVVIAIIMILSGVSLVSYFEFSRQQAAINDVRNFVTVLRRVQAKAKDLVYPTGCSGLAGYRVFTDCPVYDKNCQKVSASAVCGVGGEEVITDEQVLTDAYFSVAIDIVFKAESGGVVSPLTFPLANINNMEVKIDENGNISSK